MHLLIDGQVCVPQMAWLNPGLRHHLPGLTKLAQLVEASGNGVLPAKLDKVERAALEWLRNQCVLAHGVGYVLPMFSEAISGFASSGVSMAGRIALTAAFRPASEGATNLPPRFSSRTACSLSRATRSSET